MKNVILLISIMLSNYGLSQVVNGNFENWRPLSTTPLSEDPVGWTSNNTGIIHHYGINAVEKSNDSYSGNYAVKINQFFDSTSTCENNFLVYKELLIDTSVYSNRCGSHWIDIGSDYDTLIYFPYKLSFYYKTVNLKPSPFNWFEINVIDTTDPFGLPSGLGLQTIELIPSTTYVRKEIILRDIKMVDFQLFSINVNIKNSFDSLYKDGYVLIDNVQFEGITSINEFQEKNTISIYPNPATHNITIISEVNKMSEVLVFDIFGKQIKSFIFNSYKENIDISFFPKGVYILKIKSNGNIITKRFVKH